MSVIKAALLLCVCTLAPGADVFKNEDDSKNVSVVPVPRLFACLLYHCNDENHHRVGPPRRRPSTTTTTTTRKLSTTRKKKPTTKKQAPPKPTKKKPVELKCIDRLCRNFPGLHGNLMNTKWSPPIKNSKAFRSALNDYRLNMMKFTTVVGEIRGTSKKLPIIGDIYHRTGDLSLENALKELSETNSVYGDGKRIGVQIHFSTTNDFEESLPIIKKYYHKFGSLMVLNADILPGPGQPSWSDVVNGNIFLSKVKQFPLAEINVGWKTGNGENAYTPHDFNEMVQILKDHHITQPVCFSIRAGPATKTIRLLKDLLLNKMHDSVLSIWSISSDKIDKGNLHKLIKEVGPNRLYYDVPQMKVE